MIDAIDLILKLLACASLSIVTMVQFVSVKHKIKVFQKNGFLHVMLIIMGFSGISAILIDGYINARDKRIEAQKSDFAINQNMKAQEALIESQKKTNEALENQMNCQQISDKKTDDRHSNDSAYYTEQNNKLTNIIYGLIKTSNKMLDTTSRTLTEVKADRKKIEEPIVDLLPLNPNITLKDSNYILHINVQGINSSPANNLIIYIYFVCCDSLKNNLVGSLCEADTMNLPNDIIYNDSPHALTQYIKGFGMKHIAGSKPLLATEIYIKITFTDKDNLLRPPVRKIFTWTGNSDLGKQLGTPSDIYRKSLIDDFFIKYKLW